MDGEALVVEFGSRRIAALWNLASCCPFARVSWRRPTDFENGSLVQ